MCESLRHWGARDAQPPGRETQDHKTEVAVEGRPVSCLPTATGFQRPEPFSRASSSPPRPQRRLCLGSGNRVWGQPMPGSLGEPIHHAKAPPACPSHAPASLEAPHSIPWLSCPSSSPYPSYPLTHPSPTHYLPPPTHQASPNTSLTPVALHSLLLHPLKPFDFLSLFQQ